MKIAKGRRSGYISINIMLLFIFICILIIASTSVLKCTGRYMNENVEIFKGDYMAEESEKVVKLNFYRAIEVAIKKSKSGEDFSKMMMLKSGDEFKKARDLDYFYSDSTNALLVNICDRENRKIDEMRYVDFIIQIDYKKSSVQRNCIKRARIFNPYLYYENKDIKKLSNQEIKELFRYIN